MPHIYLYYMDRGTCTFIVGALVGGLHSHALTLTRFLKRLCRWLDDLVCGMGKDEGEKRD